MKPFLVRLRSKDLAAPQQTVVMGFPSEASRDEYWTAFWRNERGFKPMFWEAERDEKPPRKFKRRS